MNVERYPWLRDLTSEGARTAIDAARDRYLITGAVWFPNFIADDALAECAGDARAREGAAYTTDDEHTAYLKPPDISQYPANSVYNHLMRTKVASTAFDELPQDSALASLYRDPTLLELVSSIVGKRLHLSDDPLGCCSINVFRPGYHHSFHFDESEFSTTLCLQEADKDDQGKKSGLFQYTDPLRRDANDLVLSKVAAAIHRYDDNHDSQDIHGTKQPRLAEAVVELDGKTLVGAPEVHTLDFKPGTLFVFSGSRSLHRVTRVEGARSRLVAVLTFATSPGFRNSPEVQKMFWGRSSTAPKPKSSVVSSAAGRQR